MGSSLTIEETTDHKDIMSVWSNPDIWPLISFGDTRQDDADIEVGDDRIYLITKSDGIPVGINYFYFLNPKMVEFHPCVIPEFRPFYSYQSVRMGIDWVFRSTGIEKITVQIPECHDNVRQFASRMGFALEGVFTGAFPLGESMININLLGLKRSEWAGL